MHPHGNVTGLRKPCRKIAADEGRAPPAGCSGIAKLAAGMESHLPVLQKTREFREEFRLGQLARPLQWSCSLARATGVRNDKFDFNV